MAITSEQCLELAGMADDIAILLSQTEVVIPETGMLAGPISLNHVGAAERLGRPPHFGVDDLHFTMNLGTLMRLGFAGIAEEAERNSRRLEDEPAAYLAAIAKTYRAICDFIASHADAARRQPITETCCALTRGAPATFLQGVQAFWFAWVIRGHGTIGRLDQRLFPLYRADLAAGRLTREDAFAILCELWEKLNQAGHGDTLVNLMLGGQDCEGRDATNDLSLLMLETALFSRSGEPHINVRVHADTPPAFLDKVLDLQLLGHGQGTVYADEVVIPALQRYGVPPAFARNYANDGCNEVIIDGECSIRLMTLEAVKTLELALFNGEENELPGEPVGRYWTRHAPPRRIGHWLERGFRSGDITAMGTFEEVYEACWRQYAYQLDRRLAALAQCIPDSRQRFSSLLIAGMCPRSLAEGIDPVYGGHPVECNIVFSGTLTTVADALAAIKQVVFLDHYCTMTELLEALRVDFAGHEPLRRRLLAAPKFGNDDDFVDLIAADLTDRFCRQVREYPNPAGVPFWPALFNHTFNDEAKLVGATPDGRRWKDPIAEHFSPTPGRAKEGPTAVIRSVSKAPLADAVGTAVFQLSLSRSMTPPDARGKALLRDLLTTALKLGIPVMNVAIYDVNSLRDAQQHPEQYADLLVRVWGYSARYVELDEEMQEHIIARLVR